MTEDEWQELLSKPAPVPRRFIRIRENIDELAGDARRYYVLHRLAEGAKGKDVAAELGVSVSMLSKIKKGIR